MSEVTQRQRSSRLLIVEDDQAQMRTLAAIMEDEGFEVIGCSTASAALEQVDRDDIGVAVLDLRLPDLSGTELLEKLRALNDRVAVIINTAHGSFASAKDAVNLGAFAYVQKAGDPEELIRHVYRAFRAQLERYSQDLESAVAARTRELREANDSLREEICARRAAEETLQKALHDLDEQVKELTCMYEAARCMREHRTLEEVFLDVATLIPSAWQYPEIAQAKVRFDGKEFSCEPFEETEWKQTSDILVDGKQRGSVEVYYLQQRPDQDEGPFLNEERRFINEMARALSEAVEHRRAEEGLRRHHAELARVSRLSTIGEMAAGIAHGLNQPLFAVLTYAEACRLAISSGRRTPDQVLSDLERISAAAEEAGEIVRRLKDFVRKREPSRSTIDVNKLIEGAVPFIEDDVARNDVRLRLKLGSRMPAVLADSLLLQQVVLNLTRNAIEAMKSCDDGERELVLRTSTAGSEAVQVAICDTGPGLSAENVGRLFEPFFTTKSHGLGLGLSLSRSIIEAEGGRLVAEQNPDHGMTFRFTLPVRAGEANDGV